MGNVIDADLILDTLSRQAVTLLPHRLAPLSAFSRNFSTKVLPQTASVQVQVVTGGSGTLVNPTQFEQGDTTTSNIEVPVDAYSQPMHLTSTNLNQGFSLENFADTHLTKFAETIAGLITPFFSTVYFTETPVIVAQSLFSPVYAKTLRGRIGKCKKRNLILDSPAYAQLIPSDKNGLSPDQSGTFGFDAIHEQSFWTGAEDHVYGLAAGPDAIAIAAGIPLMAAGVTKRMLGQRIVAIPGLGLSVQVNHWVNTNTRVEWASYDVMFGAALGLSTAGVLVKSQ